MTSKDFHITIQYDDFHITLIILLHVKKEKMEDKFIGFLLEPVFSPRRKWKDGN